MYDFKGKTVLVTGGSTGIGAAFAEALAAEGARLVLVARGRERLEGVAATLRARHGAQVEVHAEDLSAPGAARRVFDAVTAKVGEVDVLINNAGFATYGRFAALPFARQSEELALNVVALVELTHLFLPGIERVLGGVIQVASTAAFQPVPFMAVYAATKAFVLSFSEALWGEYRDRGVRVLALCPGATDTPFFEVVGAQEAALGAKARPAEVVREGLDAFRGGRSHRIAGLGNYLTAQSTRLVPRELAVRMTAGLMKPRSPQALPTSTTEAKP
jgi:hypothetical protein